MYALDLEWSQITVEQTQRLLRIIKFLLVLLCDQRQETIGHNDAVDMRIARIVQLYSLDGANVLPIYCIVY